MLAAPPIKYVLGYRTQTLSPNPITDPNPKNNKKRKQHQNEIEHKELYLKVDFVGMGRVYKRPITGNGSQTYGSSRLLVVLVGSAPGYFPIWVSVKVSLRAGCTNTT